MLQRIWGSSTCFKSSTSTVLIKSQISSIFNKERSVRPSFVSPSTGTSFKISPFFSISTMLVWKLTIRTLDHASPLYKVTTISNVKPLSTCSTEMGVFSRNSFMTAIPSFSTLAITSSSLSGSPATIPAAAAAGMPFKWSVLGTITDFTFLMMLPLAPITTLSGSSPSTFLATAAAYARAMGSVQPMAGLNSSSRILM